MFEIWIHFYIPIEYTKQTINYSTTFRSDTNRRLTQYVSVVVKVHFRKDYHSGVLIPYQINIEEEHSYGSVAFPDAYSTFHSYNAGQVL